MIAFFHIQFWYIFTECCKYFKRYILVKKLINYRLCNSVKISSENIWKYSSKIIHTSMGKRKLLNRRFNNEMLYFVIFL